MGWRFFKRIRLFKGASLNLSKRGASFSFGGRGRSVTVGSSGARATLGIPGTGLSYSARLTGGKSQRRRRSSALPRLETLAPHDGAAVGVARILLASWVAGVGIVGGVAIITVAATVVLAAGLFALSMCAALIRL